MMDQYSVTPPNPPNEGILFADLRPQGRGGHLGHALVEYAPGALLAFSPNCSDEHNGHSGQGWMEYRRSLDGGETFGSPQALAYSKDMYDAHIGRTAMAEKAVRTADGTLVLFHLICDMNNGGAIWEPYLEPTYTRSFDGGETWCEAKQLGNLRGRIYDARYHEGVLYALLFANDATISFTGNKPEHVYQLFVSEDNGETFSLRCVLPAETHGRGYGCMVFTTNGDLLVYLYDEQDEAHPDYLISHDNGFTWDTQQKAYCAQRIRNPQIALYQGGYFLHGRNGVRAEGSGHFILYYSLDGIHWDEGTILCKKTAGTGAYSNNLVTGLLTPNARQRLYIHASHAYERDLTNVLSWWIDKKY